MSLLAGMALISVLALTIGGALVLYLLVRAEHEERSVMDRETAEQTARKDRHER